MKILEFDSLLDWSNAVILNLKNLELGFSV